MSEICGDNRFEIIAKAKAHLLDATNIDTSEDEMKVLDSFLFRCWQMGWLQRYDHECEECMHFGDKQVCGRCRYYSTYADHKTEPKYSEDDMYWLSLAEDVANGKMSDAGANQAWLEYINHKDEPTISKTEQVDKDINVRSKDEPQTEPLHTCSVNGRPYSECSSCEHFKCTADELQTEEIYPLVVIEDRYTGIYSCGKYTAWNMFCDEIPQAIDSDDVLCRDFWHSYEGVVGLGATPNEAIEDLRQKLLVFANTPKDEPQTDFWHSATKDDWLKAHGIENE